MTPRWTRSRFCASNGQCVEVARTDNEILVRDSKEQAGPVLHFSPAEMRAFVSGVKAGDFDHML
ncbi:MAG: DUF397 domain-containing protein [Actinomycetota bacterium]